MAKVYMRPIYRVTCWKCRTISDFTYKDIKRERYGSYDEYWHDIVVCPVCSAGTVLVDRGSNCEAVTKYDVDPLIDVVYDLDTLPAEKEE